MKAKLFYLFTLLLFSFSIHNPLSNAAQKESPDFTELIQSLSKQLQLFKKEIHKEEATLELLRCEIELKWVWKYEIEGNLKAFVVTGGGGYSEEEINTFRTIWKPIGSIYASTPADRQIENAKLADRIHKLEKELSKQVLIAVAEGDKWFFLDIITNTGVAYGGPEGTKFKKGQYKSKPLYDFNVTNIEGETPLMIAAAKGYKVIVQYLLVLEADINVKSKDGKTALTIAESNGHSEIVTLLRRVRESER